MPTPLSPAAPRPRPARPSARHRPWLTALVGALLALPAGTPTAAQEATATLEGRVANEEGVPVGGAQVSVAPVTGGEAGAARPGAAIGTTADGRGRFRIGGLAAGAYRVRVRALGHAEWGERILLGAGESRRLDVTLRIVPVELADLDVMGYRDRFKQAYEETGSETTVRGSTSRDFNSANAYDALRIVPGVSFLWGQGSRFGKPTRIRGASTWAIADVIEDFPSVREAGIGAEDGGLTADFGSTIPAIALDAVEVKKGSLGVLYSGGADGGVIVSRLKRGTPGETQATLWAEGSPLDEQLYMADVSGGFGTVDYYVAGKLLSGNYDEFVDEAGRALAEDDLRSGLARVGWSPSRELRLELIGVAGRDRIRYTQPIDDDPATAADESETLPPRRFRTTNRSTFAGLTVDHRVSPAVAWEAGYSHFYQRPERFSLTEEAAHRDRPERTNTLFANAYVDRALSSAVHWNLKTGAEALWHVQEEEAGDSDLEQRFRDRSVFVANALTVDERLTLTGGLRVVDADDDWDDHTLALWDAGVAYRFPAPGTDVHAGYSTGYSRNKGFAFFFGPIEEAGGVQPSETATLELGVDQRLPASGDVDGTASVAVFRTSSSRVPTFSGWGDGVVYYEEHEALGLELAARYPLGPGVSAFGSFTWLDTEVEDTTHPEGPNVGSTSVPVPRYSGALGVDVAPWERLSLGLIGTYDDGMRQVSVDPVTDEVRIVSNEAYTRVNLTSDFEVTEEIGLRLRVENLLDDEDLGYSTETLGPDGFETSESVATDPGRFASLAVRLSL